LSAETLPRYKRRVADYELGLGPVRPPRVGQGLDALAVRNRDFRHWITVPSQNRIHFLDVLEIAKDGLGWCGALGAEMPLQVAKPNHQFGNGSRARVLLKP